MSHKVEIEITNEKEWKALCRISSYTGAPVSKIVNAITELTFSRHIKKCVEIFEKECPGLIEFPEIKDVMGGDNG